MSAEADDVRYFRYLRRIFWFALAASATALAAIGAMLLTGGQASAQPLTVPGIGVIQVPDQVQIPGGGTSAQPLRVPGIGVIEVPDQVQIPTWLADGLRLVPGNPPITVHAAPAPAPALSTQNHAPEFSAPELDVRPLPIPSIIPLRQILSAPQLHWMVPSPPAIHATPHKTTGERAVEAARSKLGAAYSYGSEGPDAFDCSGLVQWSYRQAGVDLPRTSYGQLDSGTPVPLDQLKEGDLVSFYGGEHSAIYVGDGKVIHASTYGRGVEVSPMSEMPACGARRF
jgi:cell wall-associated NlpC family hydrolase